MTRFVSLGEALETHRRLVERSGGTSGVRDLGALESALAQPRMTFDGHDLYPTLLEKAAALGFSVMQNHPFVDGNKRTGHALMETFLVVNGFEILADVDDQEHLVLRIASGECGRDELSMWLQAHVVPAVTPR